MTNKKAFVLGWTCALVASLAWTWVREARAGDTVCAPCPPCVAAITPEMQAQIDAAKAQIKAATEANAPASK